VAGRNFSSADAPLLTQYVDACAIAEQCMKDIECDGRITLDYCDDHGNTKAVPQVAQHAQAVKTVAKLRKELGLSTKPEEEKVKRKEVTLHVIQSQRRTRAENSRSAATG
jgi:phage terminase small subunit